LLMLDLVLGLGCVPGAVSVSLSCDDAARAVLWGGARRFGRATAGFADQGVTELDHEGVAGVRQRRRGKGLVAQLVRAHA